MDMFSWKGLNFVTSAVGELVRLHPDTAQCVDFKLAKVFVKADLSKELPKVMKFTSSDGKESLVQFSYPWLPSRCSTCNKWGHMSMVCLMNVNTKEGNASQQSPAKEKSATVNTSLVVTEKVAEPMKLVEVLGKTNQNEPNEDKEKGEWVTLTKTGRSPDPKKNNLEFGKFRHYLIHDLQY